MSKLRIYGDTSGYVDFNVPAVASTTTVNVDKLVEADSSGNVGIGTAVPGQKLHVSSADHTRVLITGGTDKYAELQFENDAQKFAMGIQNDDKFFLYNSTGTSQVLTIDTSSRIGIGTQTPSAPIDVVTNSNVYAAEFRQSNTSNGDGVIIEVGSTASVDYALTVRSDAGNTSVLAAKADAKVGIGTFSPDKTLTVRGTSGDVVQAKIVYAGSDGNRSGLILQNTHTGGREYGLYVGNNSTGAGLGNSFGIMDNTASAYRLIIDSSGNVGIGTTSPTALLQITPPNEHQNSFRIYRGGSSGYELNYLNMSLYQGNTVFNTTSTDSSGKRYLFQINGTEKVRIDQDGELLLGTDVQGRAAEGANRLTIANDSGHSGLTIRSGTGGSNSYGSINFSDSEGGTGEYAGSIYYAHGSLGDKLVLATGGSDRITIDGTYVGIGTQQPAYALDLYGAGFQNSTIRMVRTDSGQNNDTAVTFKRNAGTSADYGLGGLWFINSNYGSGDDAYALIRARTQEVGSSGKLQFITSNGAVTNSTPAKMTINHAGDILYNGQFNFHVVSGFSAPNVAFQYDFYRATYGMPIKVTAAISHWNGGYMSYTEGMYWGFNTSMTSDVQHSYNGGNGSWTISFPTNNIIRVRMNGDASYNYASGWYIKVEGNLRRTYTSS